MKKQIAMQIKLLEELAEDSNLHSTIEITIRTISEALSLNLPLLVFGNGGSAADAMHISGELVGKFKKDRKPLNVICLNTNSIVTSAWSNDFEYESIFARQIQAHGRAGDVFIAISTSGNSPNILKAIEAAKSIGLVVIGLTGQSGGKMKDMCDVCLCAPSDSTPRIQECHLFFEHTLCACIEESLFGDLRK